MIARAHVIQVLVRKAMHVGVLLLDGLVALGQTPVTQNTKEAEPATVNARQQNAAQDLKGLVDPTVMQRRVWRETEWNKYRNETHSLEETLGALWAWRIAPSQDWGVRLKLPYEWRVARGASENGPGALTVELAQLRSLMLAQSSSSISKPLLFVVVSWLVVIFLSFSLIAPPNATANLALLVSALSVAGALFLILELDRPFGGIIQISSEPMRTALSQLGEWGL